MNSIAVIMCVWKRPERLADTLNRLDAQTDRGFDFYIVNNNPDLEDFIRDAVKEVTIPVYVIFNTRNKGMFARFNTAHRLARSGSGYDYYLILDDDYVFPVDYIEQVRREARQDAVVGVWAHKFDGGSYWGKRPAGAQENADMCGAAGMIAPRAFIMWPGLVEIPKDKVNIDDIWVSCCAYRFGIPLVRGKFTGCKTIKDGKDTWPSIKDEKDAFLDELRSMGWKV